MSEFEIKGISYRCGKMNAFQQFHVARKLGPVIAKLGPEFVNKKEGAEPTSLINLLEPAVDALSEMPEVDCDYVLHRCLAVTQRLSGQAWANVWNESAKRLAFEDIDVATMLQITWNVLADNLGGFIAAPVSTST